MDVSKVPSSLCCGCGVCVDVCPTSAIILREDDFGVLVPQIDSVSKCIHCGLCYGKCPTTNPRFVTDINPESYIVRASDEIRKSCSSGGVFSVISQYILSMGGYVAGVISKGSFAEFEVSNDYGVVMQMRGSKYHSARQNNVYKKVKELLDSGCLVVFTGCPCHVAALYSYIDKDYEKLFTVDIICHGAVPEAYFRSYLADYELDQGLVSVDFRNKDTFGWAARGIVLHYNNKADVVRDFDDYYQAFQCDIMIRESCKNCLFSMPPRQADISMGDYWNAKHVHTEMDDNQGLSLLLINTVKGKSLYTFVEPEFVSEKVEFTKAIAWNRQGNIKVPITRNRFLELFSKTKSFKKSYHYAKEWKYDVGIYGPTNNSNYGGLLTYYALYVVIKSMGYSCLVINNPIINEESTKEDHAREFFRTHTQMSIQRSVEDQWEIGNHVDAIVLGSDQVWNYRLFATWGDLLYLGFIDDSKKKISYSSSFGSSELTIPYKKMWHISKLLNHFDYVSVREKEGALLLSDNFSIDADVVLDPVFLMKMSEYYSLIKESNLDVDGRYVCSYFIDPREDVKLHALRSVSEHLRLKTINITDGNDHLFSNYSEIYRQNKIPVEKGATICDLIKMIRYSQFVVTDSFHATCLCILFNKKFITVQNSWATSRIKNILELFEMENRWVLATVPDDFNIDNSWFDPVDYVKSSRILSKERKSSLDWLKNAIQSSKRIIPFTMEADMVEMKELVKAFKKATHSVIVYGDDKRTIVKIGQDIVSRGVAYCSKKYSINGSEIVITYQDNNVECVWGLTNKNVLDIIVESSTAVCLVIGEDGVPAKLLKCGDLGAHFVI